MLAYVFWHVPSSADAGEYEAALAAFHASLGSEGIAGFRSSHAFLVEGTAWLAATRVYEDWYLVEDWAALGELSAAAVSGRREAAHAEVAAMAKDGVAGIYLLRRDRGQFDAETATWFAKPAGVGYEQFFSAPDGSASLWQRQMVLGPTPEFCSLGGSDDPATGAITVRRVRQVASS